MDLISTFIPEPVRISKYMQLFSHEAEQHGTDEGPLNEVLAHDAS